jgi:benzoyl-CoA reductase/2-hydroxyglutaryl-CoA dehydratase subunit BcrC/BadD/HgdB
MLKEEHNKMVSELIAAMAKEKDSEKKINIVVTGILADNPSFLSNIDQNGLNNAADDVAAQSRQYRTDAPKAATALDSLAEKFSAMDNCSVLYDSDKKRIDLIVDMAKQYDAQGVLMVLTKFCDPEEFDYVILKKACDKAELPIMLVEVDRQMENYEQAGTIIETFKEMM